MLDTLMSFIKGIAFVWVISFIAVIIYAILGDPPEYDPEDRDEWD